MWRELGRLSLPKVFSVERCVVTFSSWKTYPTREAQSRIRLLGFWINGILPDEGVSKVGSQGTVNTITYALRREFSELNGTIPEF